MADDRDYYLDAAIEDFRRALNVWIHHAPTSWNLALALAARALSAEKRGDKAAALRFGRDAIVHFDASLEPDHTEHPLINRRPARNQVLWNKALQHAHICRMLDGRKAAAQCEQAAAAMSAVIDDPEYKLFVQSRESEFYFNRATTNLRLYKLTGARLWADKSHLDYEHVLSLPQSRYTGEAQADLRVLP
jgi:hypothetical protein